MATIVGELTSKKPVELKPVPDQPGYYYVPQKTEFIVKKDGLPHEQQSLVGGLSSKMSVTLSPKRDATIFDGRHILEYYVIPNNTEFVLRTKHHGSAESNKVVNFVTCVQNYHYEPRFIKRCENDEETILVAINDFIVQEEDTVKISLACDFNPDDLLDSLTKIVDDIYDRYHGNYPIYKTGISFSIDISTTSLYVFSCKDKQVVKKIGNTIDVCLIDIEPSGSSLNSPDTIKHIGTVIADKLSPPYKVSLPDNATH